MLQQVAPGPVAGRIDHGASAAKRVAQPLASLSAAFDARTLTEVCAPSP
jgi:hypothetical protein